MRGTLHFVAAEDVRWMLALLAPRVAGAWERRHRELALREKDLARAAALFEETLTGGARLTRSEMLNLLQRNGVSTEGQRGYHMLAWWAQRGLICLGPMASGQQTFVLLDEWVPRPGDPKDAESLDRTAALTRLAQRYFAGHGPATIDDLSRWAGVTKRDAAEGIAQAGATLRQFDVGAATYFVATDASVPSRLGGNGTGSRAGSARRATTHLLPGFDEYYVGYRDKAFVLGEHYDVYASRVASNGVLRPTLVVDGRVVGTWQRVMKRDRVDLTVRPFRPLTTQEKASVVRSATRYGAFLSREGAVEFESG